MVDYAMADREEWGTSSGTMLDLDCLWGELVKHEGHKGSYIPEAHHSADDYARIFYFAEQPTNRLRQWYEFTNSTDIEDFIEENPFLVDVLSRAHEKIREYFRPEDSVALKVVKEPDAKNDRRLFVLVRTTLRPREALAHLDELDRDWWFGALSTAQGKLTIDVEYV